MAVLYIQYQGTVLVPYPAEVDDGMPGIDAACVCACRLSLTESSLDGPTTTAGAAPESSAIQPTHLDFTWTNLDFTHVEEPCGMAATRGDRGLMWWLLAAVGLQLTWCSASHAQYLPRYGGRSRKGIKDLWQGQVSMKRARGSSLWSSPGIVSRRRLQTGSNTTTAQSNPSASGVGAWDPTLQPLGLGPLMNLSATRQVSESGVPDLGGARYTVRLVEASTPITVAVRACLANGRQYQTYLANEMATDTAPLQVPPFATRNTSEKSGYFGLAAEMMAMMAAELNFTYEFVGPSSDGHYLQGAMDDVFFGNADVAIGPVPPSQAYFDQVRTDMLC